MREKLKKTPYLLFLLIMPLLGSLYNILNSHTSNPIILLTKYDSYIPFISFFILPYLFWYMYIFGYLVYLCYKNTIIYLKILAVIVIGELASFIIYYFIPTTVPRPSLVGNNIIIELVRFVYSHDLPNNCFPSIHVLTTIAIMISCFYIKNKHIFHSIFIEVTGILIIISTLFVKQHAILDILGSLILTSFIYGIVFSLYSILFWKKYEPSISRKRFNKMKA